MKQAIVYKTSKAALHGSCHACHGTMWVVDDDATAKVQLEFKAVYGTAPSRKSVTMQKPCEDERHK